MAVYEYDMVVVGAGSGGLTAVNFAAQLGARVALVEKHRIGGDCTWTGCVPSKALLHVAKVAHSVRTAVSYGIHLPPPTIDMAQVKNYIHQAIADIYQHETPEKLTASGIDVIMGTAHFVDSHTIQIDDRRIRSKYFLLATGAHPFIPSIPGLDDVAYLTYEQIFDNDRLPTHLIVLGSGAIGSELAQAYRRLGAEVTLIDERLLPLVDADIREVMAERFAAEGIRFVAGLATAVNQSSSQISVQVGEQTFTGDMLLVATGRHPNVAGLGLEKAGIAYSQKGIKVNEKLQTSVSHIYAAGDCTGGLQFTHLAGWQGFQAVRNALLPSSSAGVRETVPWTIFTDPEIAQAGLTEAAARRQHGDQVRVIRHDLDRVDRAVVDDAQAGFIKMVYLGNGRFLGATIVAPRAGEMIAEFALALQHNLKIKDLADTMHVYPTYSMGIQQMATKVATDSFLNGTIGKWLVRRIGHEEVKTG